MRVVAPFVRFGGQALIVAVAALATPAARAGTETVENSQSFQQGQNSGSITVPGFDTMGGTRGLTGVTVTVTFDASVTGLTADNDDPMMAPLVLPNGTRDFDVTGPGGFAADVSASTNADSSRLGIDTSCANQCLDCDGSGNTNGPSGTRFFNLGRWPFARSISSEDIQQPTDLAPYAIDGGGDIEFTISADSYSDSVQLTDGNSCNSQTGGPSRREAEITLTITYFFTVPGDPAAAGMRNDSSSETFTGPAGGTLNLPAFDTIGGTRELVEVRIAVDYVGIVEGLFADNDDPMMAPTFTAFSTRLFTVTGPGAFAATSSSNELFPTTDERTLAADTSCANSCRDCDGNSGEDFSDTQNITDAGPNNVDQPTSFDDYQSGAGLSLVSFDISFNQVFNVISILDGGGCLTLGDPSPETTVRISVEYAFAPTGACCLPPGAGFGNCARFTGQECFTLGGQYLGDDSDCNSGLCPGACCFPPFDFSSCAITSSAACTEAEGFFNGEGTDCAQVACFQAFACCFDNPTAGGPPLCTVVGAFECDAMSGSYDFGRTSCAQDTCLILAGTGGACCIYSRGEVPCAFTDEPGCQALGGQFLGAGSNCAQANCPDPCNCYWENGEPDDVEAAPSETNVPTPPSEAADDFIVPAGKVLLADRFCGCLATNDLPRWDGNTYDEPDAILNIYDDCNGKPGQLIATYTDPDYEILGDAPFGSPGQWKYIRFCWDNLQLILPARDAERRLWVSLVGVGDMDPGERYRWATSATAPDRPIQGGQAQLRSSWIVGFEDWQNLGESNAGCHDLCFELCGDLCHVVCDNGPYALDCGLKMLNTTTFGNRTADNFAIPPCTTADLCIAEVYIATNCEPSRARFDIYTNTCDTPDQLVTSRGNPEVIPQLNDGGQPVVFPSPVSGQLLTVYCLRWRFEPGSLVLDGERNYWISAYLEGTGVITEEAFVLCKQASDCHIKITQARFLSSSFGQNTWEPVQTILPAARDLAFTLMGTLHRTNPPSAVAPPQPAAPRCAGDTNNDNRVDAADLSVLLHIFNRGGIINSAADFNADGVVDAADLSILLGRFGIGC